MAAQLGGFVAAVKAVADRLLGRLPFVKNGSPEAHAPEPFSSIEDTTPNADILLEANAAPFAGLDKRERRRIDFRELLAAVSKNTFLLVGILVLLAFLVLLAITALIVGAPVKPISPSVLNNRAAEELFRTVS